MAVDFKTFLPVLTFMAGLSLGKVAFEQLVHEAGRAMTLFALNVPFHCSLSAAAPLAPVSGLAGVAVGLSGGAAQALVALFFYWLMTLLERKSDNWFLCAVGFEIAFLSIAAMGVADSVLVGFFPSPGQAIYGNWFTSFILTCACLYAGFFLVNRHVSKMPIKVLSADSIAEK